MLINFLKLIPVLLFIGNAQNIVSVIDTVGNTGWYSSIDISSDGFPIIGYYQMGAYDLKVIKCGNVSCSNGNVVVAPDTVGDVGRYASLVVPEDGLPVVSYYDATNLDLKILKCGDSSCSSNNSISIIDSVGRVGEDVFLIVPQDGRPFMGYHDFTNFRLKVAKCGNPTCSSGNSVITVDTTTYSGTDISIAAHTDGLPIIAYQQWNQFHLKVLKCGNELCSSNNVITTVDTVGSSGWHVSIAVPSDGLPIISFFDQTNDHVKIVKCGDSVCSSENKIVFLDSVSGSGGFTSVIIAEDGLPIVTYNDIDNSYLKVVKCNDVYCESGNISSIVDTIGGPGWHLSSTISSNRNPVISYLDHESRDLKVLSCSRLDCSESIVSHKTKQIEPAVNLWLDEEKLNLISVETGVIEIYEVSGKKIMEAVINKSMPLNIRSPKNGSYILKFKTTNNVQFSKIVITNSI